MDLRQTTATNLGWTTLAQALSVGSAQIVLIVLATILSTRDFGIFAACTVVSGVLTQASTLGLDFAVINSKDEWMKVVSTGTAVRMLLSTAGFAVVVALSGVLSDLFRINNLESPLILSSVACLVVAFAFPYQMNLTKKLRFKEISMSRIAGSVTWSILAIALALAGWSYWSLVVAFVSSQVAILITVTFLSPGRPEVRINPQTASKLIRFGGITASGLMVAFLAGNLDKFVVGWAVSPDDLGVYFIMFTYGTAGPSLLTGIINTVMFPTYSVLAERPEALRKAYSESLRLVAEFSSVVSLGLAAGSTLFVLVLLGDKWEAGVMSLTLLSLAGFFMSLTSPAGNVFISVGRPDLILRITLAFFLPMVPLLVLFAGLYGITGAAAVILGHESCKCIYVVYRAGTLINAHVGEIVTHIAPFAIAGIVTGLVVLAITILLPTTLVALILAILLGTTAYLVLGSVLSKGALLRDIRDGVRVMRGSRI